MFHQITKKIIALVTALCLSVSLAAIPAGAVEVDEPMIEYLSDAPETPVAAFSDTSGATISISQLTVDATPSLHAICQLRGAGTADTTYKIMVLIMNKATSEIIHQGFSDTFTSGANQSYHITYYGLEPETTYAIGFFLYDGETSVQSVSVAQSFITPAAGQVVGNEFFASIDYFLAEIANNTANGNTLLSLILTQEMRDYSLLGTISTSLTSIDTRLGDISTALGTMYTKLYQIEANTGKLVPSEQETALKEATSDVTSAYTEKFWGADSDSALGSASITESADILSGTKSLFSTGVSTSDLFGLFGRESWGRWFSEETRADLHTVPDVAVIGLDEDDAKSEYEKNLDSIRDFMGR